MTASEALASVASDSEMEPTPEWTTSDWTLSDSILLIESTIASTEPWVSALMISLSAVSYTHLTLPTTPYV